MRVHPETRMRMRCGSINGQDRDDLLNDFDDLEKENIQMSKQICEANDALINLEKERDDYKHGWEDRNRIIEIYREKIGVKDGEHGWSAVDALKKERDGFRILLIEAKAVLNGGTWERRDALVAALDAIK